MEITGKIDEVRRKVKEWRKQGLSVGLVPTMGYLHEGHKSLIDRAVAENDRVVVSDFVNPIQFGAGEDLATYPRDIEADKRLCGQAGAHLIFHPQPAECTHRIFPPMWRCRRSARACAAKPDPPISGVSARLSASCFIL